MLFNSYSFIFGFFPVVLIGFFLIARHSRQYAAMWLAFGSLFFYACGSLHALPLLLGSIIVNYNIGNRLSLEASRHKNGVLLWGGIIFNLALLGFFKYANFFISNTNAILGALHISRLAALNIVLPIGISFFTFTQLAFLVDCWQGKVRDRHFIHYLLFVSYFPHLIAGPVLHHGQMMPQFAKAQNYRPNYESIITGIAIFIVGLAKKLLLADLLGEYADALFQTVDAHMTPMFLMSWGGALSYSFQIYFDFSGYSDMAIGLSMCFGIRLPHNFNSPYKATSIIDFWRRWHITLSMFLRDYLYIPLGGNRKGSFRRYINLMITMVLGGFWHGANWTFVLWGTVHGFFLMVNHGWRHITKSMRSFGKAGRILGWLVTFLSVCCAWVMFRANNLADAIVIYKGMMGLNGISLPAVFGERFPMLKHRDNIVFNDIWQDALTQGDHAFIIIMLLAVVTCFAASNMNAYSTADSPARLRAGVRNGFLFGALFCLCLITLAKTGPSQFLYFRF